MLREIKFGKNPITKEPLEWMSLAESIDGIEIYAMRVSSVRELGEFMYDAPEPRWPSHIGLRFMYGNNNYKLSNIRQWLNSDAPAGRWYQPTHQYDEPPAGYVDYPGFLYNFTDEENAMLIPMTFNVDLPICDMFYSDGTIVNVDTMTDKVWLPTAPELSAQFDPLTWSRTIDAETRSSVMCMGDNFEYIVPGVSETLYVRPRIALRIH